jgi:hypothetical protein
MLAHENPFRTEKVLTVRYFLNESDRQSLLAKWRRYGCRGALVGPEGSGKTTLLEDLAEFIEADGMSVRWLRFRRCEITGRLEQHGSLPRHLTERDAVLIDGGELLSLPRQWKLRWRLRQAGGVLVTAHRPTWLPTIRECSTTPQLLMQCVDQLAPNSFSPEELATLFHNHHGNIREAIRALYDVAATLQQ